MIIIYILAGIGLLALVIFLITLYIGASIVKEQNNIQWQGGNVHTDKYEE